MSRRRRLLIRLGVLGLIGMLGLTIAAGLRLRAKSAVEGFTLRVEPAVMPVHSAQDLRARARAAHGTLARADYEAMTEHLLEGFLHYRGDNRALVFYPGEPSYNGRRTDGLEGFARMFPFAATWLADGGHDDIMTGSGPVSIIDALRDGLVIGTNPEHPRYWGLPGDNDQRVVEAADIALGLWLAREQIWTVLDAKQREQIVNWLQAAARAHVFQGVWQLYPVQIERVLASLGASTPQAGERSRTGYERFKALYRGDGWFFDMPKGFDYYNAWGIHYGLFWIDQIDPLWDRAFIRGALGQFAGFYKHLFGPEGFPLMGRSLCYRLAAPAPLLAAAMDAPAAVSRGEAMRALDTTWIHYVARGAIDHGAVSQGICGPDPAVLDAYSGPASCLWSLRSLVLAYHVDRSIGLFDVARESLPVERGDFSVHAKPPGWRVEGTRADGQIRLLIDANREESPAPIKTYGLRQSLLEWLVRAPRRPNNVQALYHRPVYSNLEPLSACPVIR